MAKKKNHFLLIPFQVSQFLFVFNKCDIKMNNLVAAFLFSFLANIYNIQKLLHFQFDTLQIGLYMILSLNPCSFFHFHF